MSSRSYEEYLAMFGLADSSMPGPVLDCSAGASGFAAVARSRGWRVVAVDPVYAGGVDDLVARAAADSRDGASIVDRFPDRFTWRWYGARDRREAMRAEALAAFAADIGAHPSAYVAAALPRLPFRSGAFSLALCSHLLFTWAETFGLHWHANALGELTRVAAEVRVFPLVLSGTGEPVPFWSDLLATLSARGIEAGLRPVDYEFQVGADQMLVLTSA